MMISGARFRTGLVSLTLAAAVLLAAAGAAGAATPPPQAASGPGGAGYEWADAKIVFHNAARDALDYWTYEPTGWSGAGAQPSRAPVVLFLHGYGAVQPSAYAAWLRHTARKGNLVIFPRYQDALSPPGAFTANAIWSIRDGLAWLEGNAQVKPDLAPGVILAGHSYGGVVEANIASRAAAEGLPEPQAILAAEPHSGGFDASLAGIPPSLKLVCVVGDEDNATGRRGCDQLWSRIPQLEAEDRDYVWMFSDSHGLPTLVADHLAPNQNRLDALDWYGFWKLTDGLRDCTLFDTNCAYALGGTSQQRYMGRWSDNVPARELQVTDLPPPCPSGSRASGCPPRLLP